MKKYVLMFLLMIFAGHGWAIAPPRNPDAKLPDHIVQRLKSNPYYYMPAKGIKPQVERFKQQKKGLKSMNTTDSFSPPLLHANIPVLCGQYADATPRWPIEDMHNQLFGEWPTGSMRDYYAKISYGHFDLTGDVYGWFPVSYNFEHFAEEFVNDGDFIREVFENSDVTVDFSQYDNDGPDGVPNSGDDDGYVDVVALIHSGSGAESGGGNIWSHSWSYTGYGWGDFVTNDESVNGGKIRINDYIIQPELSSGQMIEIGVFCHEFGHALGLPDLYDTDESSEGVGHWCLMAGGSYGGDGQTSDIPVHMSPWCKEVLGWIDPIVVTENMYDQMIPAIQDTPVVYKVWKNGDIEDYRSFGREYFLVENRQKKDNDINLPEAGLAIWHVDNTLRGNQDEFHKLVDLEAADGNRDMDFSRNQGDDGDVFPGSTMNRYFNRKSTPNSLMYSEEVSKVAISNISDPADTMYADIEVSARDIDYIEYTLHDDQGDGNGFLDPGETASISIDLENFGATVAQLTAVLSTNDPQIVISDSVAIYNNLPEDQVVTNSDDEIVISANVDAVVHPVKCILTLTSDNGYSAEYEVVVMMENIKILLVDDSFREEDINNIQILDYYETVLNDLQINYYDVWKTYTSGTPDSADLTKYGTLIWFTGSQLATLSPSEQTRLAEFMDNGGDLFLISQNAGYDLVEAGSAASQEFYTNYLHANYVQDVATDAPQKLMTGISGEDISKDFTPYFYASEGDGADNNLSPDIIEPIDPAISVFNYFGTGLMGKSAGLKYEGDDYKLVYFAFSYEAINEFGSKIITRNQVMSNVLAFLQGAQQQVNTFVEEQDVKVAGRYALHQNYPNPFNPQTTLAFELAEPGNTTFKIYNVLGREIRTLTDAHLNAGTHQVVWDGRDNNGMNVASGVYFYRIQANDFTELKKMVLTR